MRIKVFSLSFNMVSEPREKTLFFFWFTHVINFGNPSSDRVSFRSPFPSPKAFRSVISWSENPHHRQLLFSGDFFSVTFFDTDHIIRSARRRSAIFLKAPEPNTNPRAVFLRQSESHARRMRARGPLSCAELLLVGSSGTVLHF